MIAAGGLLGAEPLYTSRARRRRIVDPNPKGGATAAKLGGHGNPEGVPKDQRVFWQGPCDETASIGGRVHGQRRKCFGIRDRGFVDERGNVAYAVNNETVGVKIHGVGAIGHDSKSEFAKAATLARLEIQGELEMNRGGHRLVKICARVRTRAGARHCNFDGKFETVGMCR